MDVESKKKSQHAITHGDKFGSSTNPKFPNPNSRVAGKSRYDSRSSELCTLELRMELQWSPLVVMPKQDD